MEHKKGEAFKAGGQARMKAELSVGYKRNIRPVPSPPSESMKGPAFWRAASKQRRQQPSTHMRTLRESQDKVPGPPKFLGIDSWWQMCVFILVCTALLLFGVLVCLIGFYLKTASDLSALIPKLQNEEKRLNEAVKREARGKNLTCKTCPDNWMQRADACYMHTNTMMSWKDCIEKCKKYQASLVIGKTEGELDFLMLEARNRFTIKTRHRSPKCYWIGLIFNVTRKSWHWADGEYLHIRIAAIGKKPPTIDSCLMFSGGRGSILNCSLSNNCLCKVMVQ